MPLLACSILMLGLWLLGMRIVFSLPLDLRANWIFRVTPVLQDRRTYVVILAILTLIALGARWRTTLMAGPDENPMQFEEVPSWHVLTLGLPKDGGLPVELREPPSQVRIL